MSYDFTPVVEAIIALCAALVTAFVIPWVKNKIGRQGFDKALEWVSIAVKAAEQLYSSADGEKKKQYVLEFLESKGLKMDERELDNAIEAVVLEVHAELYERETEIIIPEGND